MRARISFVDIIGVALARAVARSVRVLTVSPGGVDIDFVPDRDRAMREKIGALTPLSPYPSGRSIEL